MNTELDLFPVAGLGDRYNIARSSVYARLSHLAIEPEKQGTKAFINADQLTQMDRLHDHLKDGGSMAEFGASSRPTGHLQMSSRTPDKVMTYPQSDNAIALFALAEALSKLGDAASRPTDPLEVQRTLREAADSGYELTSTQLRAVLKRKSLPSKDFTALGFSISSVGKFGHERTWKVSRG